MKQIYKDKILNIPNTDIHDNTFLFSYLDADFQAENVEVFFMWELLAKKVNTQLLENIWDKYAMYSNAYSEKDEIEIFKNLFEYAISNNKKIHIIGITLDEEIKILEAYYESLWFMREDINCFKVDFREVLVSASVAIENLIWRGSDYKRMGKEIFFLPPIREAGQTKAMFKGINRGVTAWIYIKDFTQDKKDFLKNCLLSEHILPLSLGKVLQFNLQDIGFTGKLWDFHIHYESEEIEK